MVVFCRWKLLAKLEQLSALAGVAMATAVAASVAAAAVFKTFLEIPRLLSNLVTVLPPWFAPVTTAMWIPGTSVLLTDSYWY
jgi:hypothetical protein